MRASLLNGDRGSGTVLALGLITSVLTLFIGMATVSQVWVANANLQAAADGAAVAAADALRGLATGTPCEQAARISRLNMANLIECRIVAFRVHIKVGSDSLGIVLSAEALAGV